MEYLSLQLSTTLTQRRTIFYFSDSVLSAKHLTVNLLIWEALEREVYAAQSPDHQLHGFRARIEEVDGQKQGLIHRGDIHPNFAAVKSMEDYYEYGLTSYRARNSSKQRIDRLGIEDQMVHILGHFWHLPLDSRYRAIFTRELVQKLGPASLLLDSLANFTLQTPQYYLSLPEHPTLPFVREACSGVVSQIITKIPDVESIKERMGSLQKATKTFFPGLGSLFEAMVEHPPNPIENVSTGNSQYDAFISRTFGDFPRAVHPKISTLALLIYVLLPLTYTTESSEANCRLRDFVEWVKDDTDHRFPFRDLARSRRRILEPDGPFSPGNIASILGFFSTLIYRGVTHSTEFLQDVQTVFPSLQDWNTVYHRLVDSKEAAYFCNKHAFSRNCAAARDPRHVPKYWDAAQNDSLRPQKDMSFSKFFDTIRKSKDLPAFGDLTSWLLAADYASAGFITTPESDEVRRIIHKLGMGAKKGLQLLGYPCSSESATASAFVEVEEGLGAFLTEDEKVKVGFGVFFVENVLCKLSRFSKERTFREVCKEWNVPTAT